MHLRFFCKYWSDFNGRQRETGREAARDFQVTLEREREQPVTLVLYHFQAMYEYSFSCTALFDRRAGLPALPRFPGRVNVMRSLSFLAIEIMQIFITVRLVCFCASAP